MHASIKPRGGPGQPAKPLMVCRISTLDDIGASVEHGAHTPRFGVYLALDVRAAFLCSCIPLAAFSRCISCTGHVVSGWPALWSVVRWGVRGVLRALACFVFSYSFVRAVCRNVIAVVSGFVLRTQATTFAALPNIQSSTIVSLSDGVTWLPSNQSFKADGFAAA